MTTGSNIENAAQRRFLFSPTICWARTFVLFWMCLSCFAASGSATEPVSKEYQLKAAFLYNFTKFVEWPTNRLVVKDEPIVIGVLGNNPFGKELAKAVEGRTQNGHPFLVSNLTAASEAKTVHLLFVPRGQETAFEEQGVAALAAGVLTVGESEAFARLGGIISFTTEADKIRFEINLDEAEQNGLKISSKLLQLAKAVRHKSQPGLP